MPETTDPASELARLCENLARSAKERGDKHLATQFGVEAGSADFFHILGCIEERFDEVSALIQSVPQLQQDYKQLALDHVQQLRKAFGPVCLTRPWNENDGGASFLQATNIAPLKFLSSEISKLAPRMRLHDEERQQLLDQIAQLLHWLKEFQLSEEDFIRQAIIDGLIALQFRAERLQWVGWGYTLESLERVITAYLALERRDLNVGQRPDAKALVLKVKPVITAFYSAITGAKNLKENAEFLLSTYKALIAVSKNPAATALIGFIAGHQ